MDIILSRIGIDKGYSAVSAKPIHYGSCRTGYPALYCYIETWNFWNHGTTCVQSPGLCIENIQSCISPYQQIAVGIPGQSPYGNPRHVRFPYYVLLPDIVFIQATPRPYPDAVLPLIPQQGIYRQSAGDPPNRRDSPCRPPYHNSTNARMRR